LNIGDSKKRRTQPFALWPYRIHNPGSPNHDKWIFKIVKNSIVTGANRFQFGNYYSEINTTILANNPKLSDNPINNLLNSLLIKTEEHENQISLYTLTRTRLNGSFL